MPEPTLTVSVATRDRPQPARRAIESILANREPSLEVVVVDQSRDAATEAALDPLLADSRLRYLRLPSVGLARARNEGLASARSEFVALTDDDCAVPPDWAASMVGALGRGPQVALVFGNVVPAPHDANGSFIPGYVQSEPRLADGRDLEHAVEWVGACMGLRRSAWDRLGGFDEMLGAGARFPAADEADLVLRALAGGWEVYKTPAVWVTHHGLRTRQEARSLVGLYACGTGAMMAKHLRCRTPRTASLLRSMAWHWVHGDVHPGARIGDGRHRLLRLSGFARGFLGGATAPLDRNACLFSAPGNGATRAQA